MTNTRRSEDGFRGEYPPPIDWDKIIAELEAKGRPADAGEQKELGDG